MAPPQLSEDEIDDLIYFARAGEKDELTAQLTVLADREKVTPAEILAATRDEGKSTCLHMATGNGHNDIVQLLLEHVSPAPAAQGQAFLDATNEYGNTALHWAALGGHLASVKLLVAAGASPALANDKNYVPLDLAGLGEKYDVVDYFLSQSGGLEAGHADGGALGEAVADVELEGEEAAADAAEDAAEGSGGVVDGSSGHASGGS